MSNSPLGASELIITPHGTVYHLDLHPDQLADTVITVGDPGRVATVSKHFDAIEHRAEHREFISHTGRIGSKRLTVVSTGIGPDNIDIVFNELDALANIDFDTRTIREQKRALTIVRLGTAGGLQPDIPVDSFVASSFGIGLDNLLHYYQYENNPEERFILSEFVTHTGLDRGPITPYITEGSIRLRNMFSDGFISGITATCPGFYGPQGRVLRGPLAYPHLIDALGSFESRGQRVANFEMETSAIYGIGKLLGHHCLSISAIVAQRVLKTFSKDGGLAVERLIQAALPILTSA
jgi:uridine phosphorylase